ncbi:MAG: topoisomerase [Microbacteriaceae bacterium]|nr:topoisomerase [Microbacteriaceae bacterium]
MVCRRERKTHVARLRRSNPAGPGYRRVSHSARVSYVDADGHAVRDEQVLRRIRGLVIPPAWRDVWISPDERGHIQAVGTDQAGRRQYIYHQAWRERQDQAKFDRAIELAASLPAARRAVTRDIRLEGFPERRMLAAAFRIVDLGSLRVGSEEYLHANGSRGLSTLLCRHARVRSNETTLTFPAKSGQKWTSTIVDDDLAELVGAVTAARGERARLLSWRDTHWHTLRSAHINRYIRERTNGDFTAKDFRTLRGTVIAALALAREDTHATETGRAKAISRAVRETADALGNTPTVARNSYIDPRIFDRYRSGQVVDLTNGHSPESAVRRLLTDE